MNLTTVTFDADLWQVVPKEPTEAMGLVGKQTIKNSSKMFARQMAINAFKSMLSAAPTPPTAQPLPDVVPWEERGPYRNTTAYDMAVLAELAESRAQLALLKGKK